MADFRPLVLDGTQIEELNESSDRLLVRDVVSTLDSNDKLNFTASDFRVSINSADRLIVGDTETSFLSKSTQDCKINMFSINENQDSILSMGILLDQNECVFNYNPSPSDGTADKDKNKKLTVMLEGQGSDSQQVVGIQTNLIGIGTHYRSAVVIPSRGNSAGNLGTKNDRYYLTSGICNFDIVSADTDAAATQFGLGLSIIKGGNNQFGPAIEFVKNRGDVTAGLTQSEFNALAVPQADDVLGQLIAGGCVGAATSDPPMSGAIAFKASQNWSTSKRAAYVVVETQEYVTDTRITPLTIGKELTTSDAIGGKTIQLPIAPTGSGSAYLRVDSDRNVIVQSSSKRYKKNIKDVTLKQCQNIVDNLRPVRFEFKGETIQQYGLIAEEVEQVDRVLATHNNDGEVESVNYESIAVMLLKVVKDQQAQITALETRIAALEG